MHVSEAVTAADTDRFIRFPWQIYRRDPNWVPPLISERRAFLDRSKNPFFEHADVRLLLATDAAGRIRGRIAAIINHRHVERHGEKVGFFGLFECEDDRPAAAALFGAAADFLRSRGMTVMRGPENMSVNDDIGLLVDGFDSPPAIMMPFNPPRYPSLVESCGLRKTMDLYAYYADAREPRMCDRIRRGMELCRRRYGCQVRPVDPASRGDLDAVYRVYTQAWEKNWGAVALTRKEFDRLASQFDGAVDPDLFLIATIGGEAVGFSLALPDLNQVLRRLDGKLSPLGLLKLLWYRRRIDMVRIVTMGIVEKFRNRGVDSCLYHETWKRATAKGILRGELSWILEDNTAMNNVLRNLGLKVYKRYRIYSLGL